MARTQRGGAALSGVSGFSHEGYRAKIVLGPGSIRSLPQELAGMGVDRALLIATRSATDEASRLASVSDVVAGRWDGVRQHVPAEDVVDAIGKARDVSADCLVAMGGGSAIGLAKAVAVELALPIAAVPTTYSGSEMTPIYGITSERRKVTKRDERAVPRVVVYDPELTLSLPARVSAASGMNAIAHCMEAAYAPDADPLSSAVAAEGFRRLFEALPVVVDSPDDLQARSDALSGAWLAGLALADAQMGLHHTLAHVLGGTYGLPHGEVNSVLLPLVCRFNAPASGAAMERLGQAVGEPDVPRALESLRARLRAPDDLRASGFEAAWIDEVAALTVEALRANPRPVSESDVAEILRNATRT